MLYIGNYGLHYGFETIQILDTDDMSVENEVLVSDFYTYLKRTGVLVKLIKGASSNDVLGEIWTSNELHGNVIFHHTSEGVKIRGISHQASIYGVFDNTGILRILNKLYIMDCEQIGCAKFTWKPLETPNNSYIIDKIGGTYLVLEVDKIKYYPVSVKGGVSIVDCPYITDDYKKICEVLIKNNVVEQYRPFLTENMKKQLMLLI